MRNQLLSAVLIVCAVATSHTANATVSSTGLIQDITLEEGTNFARVALTTAVTGRPACHNATFTTHYGFDVSTAKGKAALSMLTAAQLAGKRVVIFGTAACINVSQGVGTTNIEEVQRVVVFTN